MRIEKEKNAQTTAGGRSSIKMLRVCLKEIWSCEPQSLMMALVLGMMEALIPLAASLLSSLFVDGLQNGMEFASLAVMAVVGVAVLFVMNALMGKMNRSGLPRTAS